MIKIIQKRNIFFTISIIAILVCIFGIVKFGLKYGIDFKGGTSMSIEFEKRPDNTAIKEKLSTLNLGEITVSPVDSNGVLIRLKDIDEPTRQKLLSELKSNFGNFEEKQFDSIGPVMGKEMQRRSEMAILAVILAIVLYITFAFRKVSKPVSSIVYGVATIIALLHDVIIPIGVFAFLGHFYNIEIGLLFITALLTVLGFSVHDTIVVFDRIRENLMRRGQTDFEQTINSSVNETLRRSINTSLTVLLTLFTVYILGGQSTKDFALALIIGIFAGTYSSIFIASPLLVVWNNYKMRKTA